MLEFYQRTLFEWISLNTEHWIVHCWDFKRTVDSGYGHVAPRTHIGQVATILYAIVGIPLAFLFMSHAGDYMALGFKFLYATTCIALKQKKERLTELLQIKLTKLWRRYLLFRYGGEESHYENENIMRLFKNFGNLEEHHSKRQVSKRVLLNWEQRQKVCLKELTGSSERCLCL